MSYQVLARKWRPSKFAELVGQQHVKSALINGLSQQRLHHAYLFTGTRGVGKTTIARIFAKSLNCETGVSAEPCGQCNTCVDVDQGRFVDLIEIDAASRTKVGDTREILDNVQYAPTKGRYKVYLIDEVHMLSRHSFNALLKTLEEPPEHVKFLLATTDPQKLPVTILSRCLQFNLQALSQQQIATQLTHILQSERINHAAGAVALLAKYAKGSMRDGLSLTDQAIAQSGQNIQLEAVQQMLGTVDVSWSQNILSAILQSDADKLVAELQRLARQNPDLEKVLDDLLTVCHQVAMTQVLPSAAKLNDRNIEFIEAVAKQVPAQQIQVYYQLLLQGKKDIRLAPDMLSGFEMICLRLLAFNPVGELGQGEPLKKNSEIKLPYAQEPAVITPNEMSLAQKTAEIPVVEAEISSLIEPQADEAGSKEQLDSSEQDDLVEQSYVSPSVVEQESETQITDTQSNNTEGHDLAAQEAFYHELAQSQGFAPMAEGNTHHQAEQKCAEVNTKQPNFSNIDNPVLAILAARDAETSAIRQTEQKQVIEPVEQNPSSEPSYQEPELKPIEHEEVRYAHEVDEWASLIEGSGLKGLTRQLALQSAPNINGKYIELTVKQDYAHLLNEKTEKELYDVISRIAPDREFVINKSEIAQASPAAIQQNINENRQERAEQSIHQDEFVQTLLNEFEGKLLPDSIKPL